MDKGAFKRMLADQASTIGSISDIPRLYAKDAMIKPLLFYPDDPIQKVLDKLKREDINVCVVADREKRFIGEIADEDLVRVMAYTALNEPITRILDRAYNKGFAGMKAGDLARRHKKVVSEDTPINSVLKAFYRGADHNVVVANSQGKVSGMITLSSLLRLLSRY